MKTRPTSLARAFALLGALAILSGSAFAASPACGHTAAAHGSGMGGTGAVAEGSGMGGTGAIAEGSGMGGTGIRPEAEAGSVIFSQGTAEAQGAGGKRPLVKGAPVCAGETIVTSSSAKLQIRMADGGLLSIRPDTTMKIEEFRFDGKEDGTEKSVITLLRGGFRALTGMIGHTHKENYAIRTPFASIGIRGTDHEPMFIPNPAPGEKASGQPGTYDKVNSGGVVIRNAQGSVEVRPDQIGFVPNDAATSPVLLKEMPAFYRAARGAQGEGASRGHGEHEPGAGAREHEGRGGRGDGGELRAPEPPSSEVKSPEVKVPEIRVPEAPEAPGAED